MNRTLLLIICDFLLLSLLALARFDSPEEESSTDDVLPDDPIHVQEDIIDVLQLSLQLEQESNENMSSSLQETQDELDKKESALEDTQSQLTQRELELLKEKQEREELDKAKKDLETNLDARIAVLTKTQKELVDLNELTRQQERAAIEQQQKMDQLQKELRDKLDAIAAAEEREKMLEAEKEQATKAQVILSSKLLVAETESRLVRENLEATQGRANLMHEENQRLQAHATQLATQLTEGVAAQSVKLSEIAQEVRDSQPVSPNIIYSEFTESGVTIDVRFHKTGRMADDDFMKSIRPVVVNYGGELLAVFAWSDLDLSQNTLRSERLNFRGDIRIGRYTFSLTEMELLSVDPRIVTVPLKAEWAEFLKADVFEIPNDPLKFDETVLINRENGDYGSIKFFKDMNTPGYFKLDSRFVNRLGGEVKPEKLNALFTLSGEFLGVMVNSKYAVHIENFLPAKKITVGGDTTLKDLRDSWVRVSNQVARMPKEVQ